MINRETNTRGLNDSDIIFADNLDAVTSVEFAHYAIHILCKEGTCTFRMINKTFHVKKGDFVIFTAPQLISEISTSFDFQTVLYASFQFARNNMPNTDYDLIGSLSLLENPVLSLTQEEVNTCEMDL